MALVACLLVRVWAGVACVTPAQAGLARGAREAVPEAEAQHQAQQRQPELPKHHCVWRPVFTALAAS